ncbi:MAG: hypothetical protein QF467_01045, partial [SAR202 cluster bacterium]|nr:hypothetical protein [SAR202 cluster bacterium]
LPITDANRRIAHRLGIDHHAGRSLIGSDCNGASIPKPPADGDSPEPGPGPFADSRAVAVGNPRTDPFGSDAGD